MSEALTALGAMSLDLTEFFALQGDGGTRQADDQRDDCDQHCGRGQLAPRSHSDLPWVV